LGSRYRLLSKKSAKGEMRMVRHDSGLPHENPCAQCGKPIAAPDWIENGPRRISYLWHCRACDYEFEAVAFYDASHPSQEALAA
jgi:ribosomal protein L37AE/L43A